MVPDLLYNPKISTVVVVLYIFLTFLVFLFIPSYFPAIGIFNPFVCSLYYVLNVFAALYLAIFIREEMNANGSNGKFHGIILGALMLAVGPLGLILYFAVMLKLWLGRSVMEGLDDVTGRNY